MIINADNIKTLRAALQVKLDEFAKENGLNVGGFNIKFTDTGFRLINLEFGVAGANPAAAEGEALDPRFLQHFKRRAKSLGLSEEMLGKKYVLNTRSGKEQFELLGMHNSKLVIRDKANQIFRYDALVGARLIIAQFAAM